MTDRELIERYVAEKDQWAFAELVRRHVGWVCSCAKRLMRDEALAEDVVQAAFILLARKAGGVRGHVAGWLFRTTQYCAREAMRSRALRQKHEREAAMQRQSVAGGEAVDWEQVWPVLDEAVGRLRRKDREAVLLRFYRGMSFAEVGAAEGIGEEAAKKRVQRAVEKLRGVLERQGVTAGATGLGAVMAERVTEAVPERVVEGVMAAVNGSGVGTAGVIAKGAGKMMAWAKVKTAALVMVVSLAMIGAALAAASSVVEEQAQRPASAPTNLVIKLVGPGGRPVAGASLGNHADWSEDRKPRPEIGFLGPIVPRLSDPQGRLTVTASELFDRSQDAVIYALGKDHSLAGLRIVKVQDLGGEVEVSMLPACRIFGKVTPQPGLKLTNTHVDVSWRGKGLPILCNSAQGRYEFVLPAGTYSLVVWGQNGNARNTEILTTGALELVPGRDREFDLGIGPREAGDAFP